MPSLSELLDTLLIPFSIFRSSGEEMYLLYFLTGVPLTLYAYRKYHTRRDQPFSAKKALRFLFPTRILKHRSFLLDCRFFMVNVFLFSILLGGASYFLVDHVAPWTIRAMTYVIGHRATAGVVIPRLVKVAYAVSAFVLTDLTFYIVHYLFHRVPWLWEFHKVHHSVEAMTPIAAYRGHPFNTLCSVTSQAVVGALVGGVFAFFYPGVIQASTVLSVNALTVSSHLLGGYLRHTNVWLHYGRPLNYIIYSPAHHQIHHSTAQRHWDKNLGGQLALWDWLFGTIDVPREREKINVGLDDGDGYRTVPQLYFTPLVNLWRLHIKPLCNEILSRGSAQLARRTTMNAGTASRGRSWDRS